VVLTRVLWTLALLSPVLPLPGCHTASEHDCTRAIDRIVELELKEQGITNPAIVAQRKKDIHAQKGNELLEGCVGNRIRSSTMSCIEHAESWQEYKDKCFQ